MRRILKRRGTNLRNTAKEKTSSIAAVDLFCGAGGLTHGLLMAGVKVVAGIDCDPAAKYAFEKNNAGAKFIQADIKKISAKSILNLFPKASKFKLLAGCAPCQPFSNYSNRYEPDEEKWDLLSNFGKLVKKVKPDFVTMENVPELKLRSHQVFLDFVACLEECGYRVAYDIVDCTRYGVPQHRKRLVLLASLHKNISLPKPSRSIGNPLTVKDAIHGLPKVEAGGPAPEGDPLHLASGLSKKNLNRIRSIKQGQDWKSLSRYMRAKCHKKDSGKTYRGVYGRMRWNKPAPTMTTQCFGFGNGRFGHPTQDRAITLREAALIQSFPSDYEFEKPGNEIYISRIGRLIGNAVPVNLGKAIGRLFVRHASGIKRRKKPN